MKKLEEDPDLELSLDHRIIDQTPLIDTTSRVLHEEETDIENWRLQILTFWGSRIDWDSEFLEIDTAPFCIMEDTQMSKIHFMFSMLNIA